MPRSHTMRVVRKKNNSENIISTGLKWCLVVMIKYIFCGQISIKIPPAWWPLSVSKANSNST